jgi:hypothetical protein
MVPYLHAFQSSYFRAKTFLFVKLSYDYPIILSGIEVCTEEAYAFREAAKRPFLQVNEPKKTHARSARARSAAKPTSLNIYLGRRAKGRGTKGRGMMFVCSPSQLGINAQQTGE